MQIEFLADGAVYTVTAEVPTFRANALRKVLAIFVYPNAIEIAIEKFRPPFTASTILVSPPARVAISPTFTTFWLDCVITELVLTRH
jgi:hypothetical protein